MFGGGEGVKQDEIVRITYAFRVIEHYLSIPVYNI